MLQGFHPPYTPKGKSSLVEAPPWHFAGQALSLSYDVDVEVAQQYLPPEFGEATGKAYGHFCDWQSTTTGWEMLEPAYAQYKEYIVLIEARRKDSQDIVLFCPLIWVDQDISLVRGLLQGWPKKLGQIWVTRSYNIDHCAAAFPKEGTRLGATVVVKERRLVEAQVTLDGGEGKRLGLLSHPAICLAGTPSLIGQPDRGTQRLLRPVISDVVVGPLHSGTATVIYHDSPHDEIGPLSPKGVVEVSLGQMAFTVTGSVEV